MRWAITGTPGTGKTTVGEGLESDHSVVHLNDVIQEEETFQCGYDSDRDSRIANTEALAAWLEHQPDDLVVESHLSHLLPVDRVIVLRCRPDVLRDRLDGREGASIEENVESERLDIILVEALDRHGADSVFEIDTTARSPDGVTSEVAKTIAGEIPPESGKVTWLDGP